MASLGIGRDAPPDAPKPKETVKVSCRPVGAYRLRKPGLPAPRKQRFLWGDGAPAGVRQFCGSQRRKKAETREQDQMLGDRVCAEVESW